MSDPIISVSGLRGVVGESLTPLIALRYAQAFAQSLPPGPVLVARDGRTTGPMLAAVIHSTLAAMGRQVLDAGIAATPTVGVLVQTSGASGGIQISASHNPLPYNGLKLFSREGRVIPAVPGKAVLETYRAGTMSWVSYDQVGQIETLADTTSAHLERLLKTVDVAAIRQAQFRVLLDSNCGAGSILGRKLLAALGCDVTILGGEPTGLFEHPAEPTAANLSTVREKILAAKAQIGFCQDPDADRLAIIDENGRYIGEEFTLALCLAHVLAKTAGPIVTNCATSRMSQDLATKYDTTCSLSAVGEANVVDEMLRTKAVFGGEGNGGPIDPRVVLVRDSFVGMAQILAAMAERKLPVSHLADELPRYEICKTTLQFSAANLPAAFDKLENHFAGNKFNRLDGLRIDTPSGWLIVRGSNTEPIVRIIAEAPTQAAAEAYCQDAASVMGKIE